MDRKRLDIVQIVERRRKWPAETIARIIEEALAPGATVAGVADRHGVARSQVYGWLRKARAGKLPGISVSSAACTAFVPVKLEEHAAPLPAPPSAPGLADELLEIADNGTNDWMKRFAKDGEDLGWAVNGEHIARSRLRVDTRKWLLSKCLPKVFGDRITTEHTGPNAGPVPVIHSGMTVKEAAAAYERALKGIGEEV
jgi:transposase-like protein